MERQQAERPINPLDRETAIELLLGEYRAMYQLAEFRMASLDRRVPAAGATIVAFLGVLPLMPEQSKLILLFVVPASLIWFVRTTINHARSFEDTLRRIEWLERKANELAGEALLGFQSRHPSRVLAVGGRTSVETIGAALLAATLILLSCLAIANTTLNELPLLWLVYYAYIAAIALHLIACIIGWRRYRPNS